MRNDLFLFGLFLTLMRLGFYHAADFKFTNVICKSYNESWFLIHNCRLKAVNRHKTSYNFNGTILYPGNHIIINIQLFKKENGYKPWLYKITFDLCRFLKKAYNPVAILVFKLFKDYSNFNHPCPFVGRQLINDLHLSYDALPLPMPTGEFLIEIDCFFDLKILLSTKLYFQIREDFTRS
ncbi:uncharacterized protein Dvir_GJ21292 [Drosophila virilis]|uniref:MD-2-related lipid-recognition domain-containing protein n=1 Tax=Drosophila virilis TaxID=7244 RepID=B4LN87_DROVI|nr:uncharacterized protein Dvir_GJ21292 [Drosophila virilis]